MSQIRDSARPDARTITVSVTFFADLRRFLPRGADGPQPYTIPESATAADLLAAIGLEAGAEVTIAVDGELAERDTLLRNGSEIMLLNPMEGGAAAEGEATSPIAGGAAAEGEATNPIAGGAAESGEAAIHFTGG
ncbi:MAG TPA: MoaD/ThiS family protein [Terriglobales bacterium]|nr:MoaD/ThiS family protein [Terriglobales bacterium]